MAGGYNNQFKALSSVEIMSPLGTNWRMMTSLPSPRQGLTLVTVGDKVRLVGGYRDGIGSGYDHDPNVLESSELSATTSWNVIPDENLQRSRSTAILILC